VLLQVELSPHGAGMESHSLTSARQKEERVIKAVWVSAWFFTFYGFRKLEKQLACSPGPARMDGRETALTLGTGHPPLHTRPSPLKPFLHVQLKVPGRLLQAALEWHGNTGALHSSMSAIWGAS
jgi:hypothetical protein